MSQLSYKKQVVNINNAETKILAVCSVLFNVYQYISYAEQIKKLEIQMALMNLKLEFLDRCVRSFFFRKYFVS